MSEQSSHERELSLTAAAFRRYNKAWNFISLIQSLHAIRTWVSPRQTTWHVTNIPRSHNAHVIGPCELTSPMLFSFNSCPSRQYKQWHNMHEVTTCSLPIFLLWTGRVPHPFPTSGKNLPTQTWNMSALCCCPQTKLWEGNVCLGGGR